MAFVGVPGNVLATYPRDSIPVKEWIRQIDHVETVSCLSNKSGTHGTLDTLVR